MTTDTNTTEQPEATEPTAPDVSALNDLGRLFLSQIAEQVEAYNSRTATLSAATGDSAKAVHDLRNSSDDPKIVKFRKWLEEFDAKREKAISEIDAYISENLLPSASMSEEEIEAERTALKTLRSEINSMRDVFLALPAVKSLENSELLLPKVAGTRTVSKGTGSGGVKPRVTGVYIDGNLVSHEVTKDGKTTVKSSFTDAVKFLSETHKVKVNTPDLHAAYFEAAKVKPEDWASGPDKVEFGFHVTDKDGKSQNHTILVTK